MQTDAHTPQVPETNNLYTPRVVVVVVMISRGFVSPASVSTSFKSRVQKSIPTLNAHTRTHTQTTPCKHESLHTNQVESVSHSRLYPPSSTGVEGQTQEEQQVSITGQDVVDGRMCHTLALVVKDKRVTSLKPLFLMLSFLALTKSNSLPYSSLKRRKGKA